MAAVEVHTPQTAAPAHPLIALALLYFVVILIYV
jgi:hypothetical protein